MVLTPSVAALRSNQRRQELHSRAGQAEFGDLYQQYGQALSFRFVHDEKGWRLLVTTAALHGGQSGHPEMGAMGLDINADHLALALVDRHGNPLNKWSIPCHTVGKTSGQRQAIIGEACKEAVRLAKRAGVPLVMEKLSFRTRKQSWNTTIQPAMPGCCPGWRMNKPRRRWSVAPTARVWMWPVSTQLIPQ